MTAWARKVVDGRIVAGHLTRLACQRHLGDLKSGRARGLVWDRAAALHAIEFFSHLRHSTGEWAGQPFDLQPWQQFVVGSVFGWKRADGLRRFRTAYVEVARKNGNPREGTTAAQNAIDWNDPKRVRPDEVDFTGQGIDRAVYGKAQD